MLILCALAGKTKAQTFAIASCESRHSTSFAGTAYRLRNSEHTTAVATATLSDSEPRRSAG